MREYFKVQIDANSSQKGAVGNISNILAGLLCAFQILETGAASFEMDEKDFVNTLYAIIQRMFEQPRPAILEAKDF
jgi:hypothetical protein